MKEEIKWFLPNNMNAPVQWRKEYQTNGFVVSENRKSDFDDKVYTDPAPQVIEIPYQFGKFDGFFIAPNDSGEDIAIELLSDNHPTNIYINLQKETIMQTVIAILSCVLESHQLPSYRENSENCDPESVADDKKTDDFIRQILTILLPVASAAKNLPIAVREYKEFADPDNKNLRHIRFVRRDRKENV